MFIVYFRKLSIDFGLVSQVWDDEYFSTQLIDKRLYKYCFYEKL